MPAKILVVDDSPSEQKVILDALRSEGYTLITADDGEEALKQAQNHIPDLILLDIILPKKNGFQVCRQLKTAPGTEGIKILLVTSKTQDSDRFWGLRQGADDYITKPFETEELRAAVAKHL